MDDLPTDYDAIVVGTGMGQSIVAGALSRIGKTVLHLDPNDYYGEAWGSFNLEFLKKWIENQNCCETSSPKSIENFENFIEKDEKLIKLTHSSNIWNAKCDKQLKDLVKDTTEVPESTLEDVKTTPENESMLREKELEKLSKKFNLDLCPKLLFSRGSLVEVMLEANVARTIEFKCVSRVLTWRENQLEPVPCSRADVFATKNITVVQKRLLVQILTLLNSFMENSDGFEDYQSKTFLDFLKQKKLPDNLIHYILYAIAMGDDKTPCIDGVLASKMFLHSLGRFGNSPFIFPLYGSGELPQCFCRLSAVFGGIYCLQRGIQALIVKDNKCVGVISNKQRLNAKVIILPSTYVPEGYSCDDKGECISRGIYITDRSILPGDKEALTLLQYPPVPKVSENSVRVIEMNPTTYTCPDNYFVVHMTSKMSKDAESDLKHVVESIFGSKEEENGDPNTKPNILWSSTWNASKGISKIENFSIKNVKICCSVDSEVDYESCVKQARTIFEELYPGEPFLPRAPNPDEIILDVEQKDEEVLAENLENSSEVKETEESDLENSKITENATENSDDVKEITKQMEDVMGDLEDAKESSKNDVKDMK